MLITHNTDAESLFNFLLKSGLVKWDVNEERDVSATFFRFGVFSDLSSVQCRQ